MKKYGNFLCSFHMIFLLFLKQWRHPLLATGDNAGLGPFSDPEAPVRLLCQCDGSYVLSSPGLSSLSPGAPTCSSRPEPRGPPRPARAQTQRRRKQHGEEESALQSESVVSSKHLTVMTGEQLISQPLTAPPPSVSSSVP